MCRYQYERDATAAVAAWTYGWDDVISAYMSDRDARSVQSLLSAWTLSDKPGLVTGVEDPFAATVLVPYQAQLLSCATCPAPCSERLVGFVQHQVGRDERCAKHVDERFLLLRHPVDRSEERVRIGIEHEPVTTRRFGGVTMFCKLSDVGVEGAGTRPGRLAAPVAPFYDRPATTQEGIRERSLVRYAGDTEETLRWSCVYSILLLLDAPRESLWARPFRAASRAKTTACWALRLAGLPFTTRWMQAGSAPMARAFDCRPQRRV